MTSAFVIIIVLFFGSILLFPVRPTEHSKEWLIKYRYENQTFLYIVNGERISDKLWKEHVVINDTIFLVRDSIKLYINKELFGKDLVSSPGNKEDEDYEEFHSEYYRSRKKRLMQEIPGRIIFNLVNEN